MNFGGMMGGPGGPGGRRREEREVKIPIHGGPKPPRERVRSFEVASATVWLTPENASFSEKNGFLYITFGEDTKRCSLCREFPFELLWEFISVLDEHQEEIGIIRDLSRFDAGNRKLLEQELNRRYYAPVITAILSMKERHGLSYWRVMTKDGEVNFILHDTYRSILHAGAHRLLFLDVDGNRFDLPDVTKLDKKSYKKIELYL